MLNHIIKILIAFVIIAVLYTIGCSETYFGSLKTVSCEDFTGALGGSGTACGRIPVENPNRPDDDPLLERNFLEFKYNIPLGKIDIIFVVDNSSSMHEEHKNLARQFKNFLDDIRNLDYHISIITTDISNSPDNPTRGASYQDGRFIPIGGRSFLRNSKIGAYASDRDVSDFIHTLVRPETAACDSGSDSGQTVDDDYYFRYGVERKNAAPSATPSCPSYDERGIYALNLAIENPNHGSFFRSGAHLMAVLISDEDERSSFQYISERLDAGIDYQFERLDHPEFLVANIDRIFPLKSFSFHSIIIPPGDHNCYKRQMTRSSSGPGSGRGFYGEEYARLSKARDKFLLEFGNLLRGNVISICNSDYGSQLGRIAIYADTIRASLTCSEPERITFIVDGRKANLRYVIEGRTLIIREDQVSLSSKLELQVICEE